MFSNRLVLALMLVTMGIWIVLRIESDTVSVIVTKFVSTLAR